MAIAPFAIVMVNLDISNNVRDFIVKQLVIDEVIDGSTFDARVAANPNYPDTIKADKKRLLVQRSYQETNNRELVDVAIYVKHGLAAVEKNRWGPKDITVAILILTWNKLGIY